MGSGFGPGQRRTGGSARDCFLPANGTSAMYAIGPGAVLDTPLARLILREENRCHCYVMLRLLWG